MANDEPLPIHAVEDAHEALQEEDLPPDQRSWTFDVGVAYKGQGRREVELISDDGFTWRFEGKLDLQNSEIDQVRALVADANGRRRLGIALVKTHSWLQSATVRAGVATGTGAIIEVRLVFVCGWRAHSNGAMVTLSRRGFAMTLPDTEVERLCAILVPGILYTALSDRGGERFRAEWNADTRSPRAKRDNIVGVLEQPIPD